MHLPQSKHIHSPSHHGRPHKMFESLHKSFYPVYSGGNETVHYFPGNVYQRDALKTFERLRGDQAL